MKRVYFIDNLRWICIVLLIPFHTAMAWNTWECNYIWFGKNKLISSVVIMICSFYMPLLFTIAGISMKYALQKRTYRHFIKERIEKLFLPLLSGVLTVVAVMTYYADRFSNQYKGSFVEHYSVFLGKIGDLTGYDGKFTVGHLWFLLFLFIVSILFLLIVMIQRKFLPDLSFANIKLWQIFLLVVFPILFSYILDFDGKSIGESFALVALGYYVFSEKEVINKLMKLHRLLLTVALIASFLYTVIFVWYGLHNSSICMVLDEISKWCGILGFLGFGKKHLEFSNSFTKYMTVNSFPIYIFHFAWIIVLQYYLQKGMTNSAGIYGITVVGAYLLTIGTVELVKKIPGLRFVFGMRKKQGGGHS